MSEDDEGTVIALKSRRAIFEQLVGEFDGHEFGSVGDSLMAQFASAVNAVRCARAIQHAVGQANDSLPAERRMQLRIGVDLGDVIEEEGALFGDGVNVAARLQALAEPGGILVSAAVYEQVRKRLDATFVNVGARAVKNIAEPVNTYAVLAPAAGHRLHRLLAFLRHRGVLVALAYVLASWLAVFAFGRLAPADAPIWLRAAAITLLAAGFVPAIACAWRFDARHPVARWARVAVICAAVVASTATVASVWRAHFHAAAQAAIARPVPKAQPVVAVAALRNLTRDPRDDWLGEGVANLVRDGLTESKRLIVVSPTRWQAVLRTAGATGPAPAQAAVMTAAARAGIDYVVTGEFLPTPEGLILTARLSDVSSGIELGAHRVAGLTPQALLGESTRIALLVKRTLGVPYTETYESLAADFAVGNMEAYEAYLAGIAYLFRFDYRAAKHSLKTALELAPKFYMARYRLAQVDNASGDTESALAALADIPADAPLTRRERLYVDGARALYERDGARAKEIFTKALAEFPYDIESQFMLALAYYISYEEDAAIAQYRRMLQQEPQNDRVWTFLAETCLSIGDYAQAHEALNRYLALEPDDPHGFTILGQLDQFEGNLAGAMRRFRHALELVPGFAPARLALAEAEVLAGAWDDADARLAVLARDADAPSTFRIDAAFALNGLRLARGRFLGAIEPLQRLAPQIQREQIREAMALAQQGRAQGERGHYTEARALISRAIGRSPGLATRYLFARGSLARLRGDVAGLRAAAAAIRTQKIEGNDDRAKLSREDAARAAAYLEGLALLVDGNDAQAVEQLRRVVAMPGYRYAIYDLGLAQALLAAGRAQEALPHARAAAMQRDPGDARLDLEIDRTRALLLEAEILAAAGSRSEAAERARAFLKRWAPEDRAQPERVRAERLAAGAVSAERAARVPHRPSPNS